MNTLLAPVDLGQHALHLGIVDAAHLVLVPEVAHRALVVQHREALAVERDVRRRRGRASWIAHGVRLVRRIGARHAGRRIERVVARPFGHRRQVVQRCASMCGRWSKRSAFIGLILLGCGGGAQHGGGDAPERGVELAIHVGTSWRRNPPVRAPSGWPARAARGLRRRHSRSVAANRASGPLRPPNHGRSAERLRICQGRVGESRPWPSLLDRCSCASSVPWPRCRQRILYQPSHEPKSC